MSLKMPKYIENAQIIGRPINYQWNTEIVAELMERENKKLESAVEKLTFKAGFALGIAITEWIVYRFEGHAELTDAYKRIEAAWAGVVDPAYVNSLEKELSEDEDIDDKEVIDGPLEATLYGLGEMFNDYCTVNIASADRIVTQALLARHLVPAKKAIDDWLSASLRRATKVFPLDEALFNSGTQTYTLSHEEPVSREFFELDLIYTEPSAKVAIKGFLKTLEPERNPYLRSALR